jgi:Polyketide cyclase / dehydrase and lipid transport
MRIIKLVVISCIFFFLLITGISLFIPSRVRISKAIDIAVTKDSLFKQISNPKNWKNWYPGADTAVFFLENGVVKGIRTDAQHVLMIRSVTDSTVFASHIGPGSGQGDSGWRIYTTPGSEKVTLQWFMDFRLRWYPWEKFSGLMFENRYGPEMEKALSKLKWVLEK